MDVSAILSAAEDIADEIVAWRRRVHEWPELGFEEERTAAMAASALGDLGWRVRSGVGRTGVVGELGEGGPVVALRADMDALPIEEASGEPFASRRPGLMHACGHDAHVAMLLGAAKLLSGRPPAGTVRLLFQPSEESADVEGLSGAARMIHDGAMQGVDAVFAQHVITELPTGVVGVRSGVIQASADTLRLTVNGVGVHAAQPHLGRDTIYIAAQLITALQSVVSRTVDPLEPAVVSLGTIHGGTRGNIIPERVVMNGTIRALGDETRRRLHSEVRRVAGIAQALGGDCEVEISGGYPVTLNSPDLVELLSSVTREMLGDEMLHETEPTMGAEDFSLLAREARGCIFRLGATARGQEPTLGHSPGFRVDERVLPVGAALLTACALRFLGSEAK